MCLTLYNWYFCKKKYQMKILGKIFSMKLMAVALFIYLVAIGMATMVESTYDIQTAKVLVYNSRWFELLHVYLLINLIVNIFRHKMYQRQKIAIFSFHLAFIIIIVGAAITRYYSFEGMMMVREGASSNVLYANEPHISFTVLKDNQTVLNKTYKKYLSQVTRNNFTYHESAAGKNFTIEYLNFEKGCVDSLVQHDSIQNRLLEVVSAGKQSNYVNEGKFALLNGVVIGFDAEPAMPGVFLTEKDGELYLKSKVALRNLPMTEMAKYRQAGMNPPDEAYTEIPTDTLVPAQVMSLYETNGASFVLKGIIDHAEQKKIATGKKDKGVDILTVRVSDGTTSKVVALEGGIGKIPTQQAFEMNGLKIQMSYGSVMFKIPFSIYCKKFVLDTYPGSDMASSYSSYVTVLDGDYKKDKHIYMNHVLDYRGFRFFQSAYSLDNPATPENEQETHLSVNYDSLGTNITYLGYLLMGIGMFMTVFSPNGQISELLKKVKKSNEKRASGLTMIALLLSMNVAFGQEVQQIPTHSDPEAHEYGGTSVKEKHKHEDEELHGEMNHVDPSKAIHRVISKEHAAKLGELLVQDYKGRVIPYQTMAQNLLIKFYGKPTYKDLDAVQLITSMHMYPDYWIGQKMISVPKAVRERLGLKDYVSFVEIYDDKTGEIKFFKEYEEAHQKMDAKKSEFDKKLIKFIERHQIIQAFFTWQYFKMVPIPGDLQHHWSPPFDAELLKKDSTWSFKTIRYLSDINDAAQTNDYTKADKELAEIKAYQRKMSPTIVPTEQHVKVEIAYNKMHIFKNVMFSYLILGLILLIISFIRIFKEPTLNSEKFFKKLSIPFTILMVVAFLYHGIGLGIRWYVSGHAPWSDGYEAVVFISWATMIAGFMFARKNHTILAVTAILAFFMIFITEMNLLDPEISPLEPVLKSYWLMIHVAVITSSYGFLGLGAIIGLLNMTLYNFRTQKNGARITANVNELTYVSEITMEIGLFLLFVGTFLGGVWANESWGRYWGWDPKETWALVSVLVYSVLLHLRFIPKMSDKLTFNVLSFWSYSAIIFTFLGVNFYLVGLHSYAQGDGLAEFPMWIFWSIFGFYAFSELTAVHYKLYRYKTGDLSLMHFVNKFYKTALIILFFVLVKMYFLDRAFNAETLLIGVKLISLVAITLIVMFVYGKERVKRIS